jgi:WXXGXW repeat (2 copies)
MRNIRYICYSLPLLLAMLFIPATSSARVGISITIAPPSLPVYVQPACPGDGYIWTPGYWAYGDDGYYWVPGTWVLAPEVGFLWTPGYWGWSDGVYVWNAGYWGPTVGFYGGINYGFGYIGVGYAGGYWNNGHFFYNRAVNNINVSVIHDTYSRTVINRSGESHVSFNGGRGGTTARPTPAEIAAAREHHIAATSSQIQQERAASRDRSQWASVNHGKPAVAATAKPGEFRDNGVVAAKSAGGRYVPASNRSNNNRRAVNRRATNEPRAAEKGYSTRENKPTARENKTAPERSATPRTNAKESKSPSHNAEPRSETRPSTKPSHTAPPKSESRTESKRAPSAHPKAPREETRTESKPSHSESAPRTKSRPHESAPKAERAPEHSSPKPETKSAPKAERAPAHHESSSHLQSKPQSHGESERPH